MDDGPCRVQALHRHLRSRDGEQGPHTIADPAAHDPAREGILDRAEVELAVTGRVLGDIGQPQLVEVWCGERTDPVVVRRWPSLTMQSAFLRMQGPEPVRRLQPPHSALGYLMAGRVKVVGDEPVPGRKGTGNGR